MQSRGLFYVALLLCVTLLSGCGGNAAPGGGASNTPAPGNNAASSDEHDKLMNEALDLSIKILNEVQSGKDVPSVDAAYEKQLAELDARIAKLPKLTDDETIKRMHALGGKYRDIDEKTAAIALKGRLPKLPNYTLYTEEKPASGK